MISGATVISAIFGMFTVLFIGRGFADTHYFPRWTVTALVYRVAPVLARTAKGRHH